MTRCLKCNQDFSQAGGCPHCVATKSFPEKCEFFATAELCKVTDEIMGMAIKSFLLDRGVESILRDMHGSFYGGVLTNLQGYWGSIMVDQADEEKAKKLYQVFQKEFQGR